MSGPDPADAGTAAVALLAVLVTLGVTAAVGPSGRPARALDVDSAGRSSRARGSMLARVTGRLPRPGSRSGQAVERADLATVVTEVASQLRAGADPARAWQVALGRPLGAGGRPDAAALAGRGDEAQVAAVLVAGELARELGAPLAAVLDRVAQALAAGEEAEGERRAALAGPRATAGVLTMLPVLGVVLGTAVGADPVAVLLDGGIGTLGLAIGAALLAVGRWWIARLVMIAARAGDRTRRRRTR
ncbi:type II secretion system F family protein [Cellulomonas fimi]|uniref:Type II secretion system F domain protein n=1 Tax=Cellulomonas fimi TaxID=1708 RepID=A0A7Y0LXL3_CELFI|nr:hypothetical protein [Cellulomonas fimi]NMR19779.1 hypothetical protein [Cellulomonas fimi]